MLVLFFFLFFFYSWGSESRHLKSQKRGDYTGKRTSTRRPQPTPATPNPPHPSCRLTSQVCKRGSKLPKILGLIRSIGLRARARPVARWYVDGVLFCDRQYWYSRPGPGEEDFPFPAPFDTGFYLIANVAVGGSFTGGPIDEVKRAQSRHVAGMVGGWLQWMVTRLPCIGLFCTVFRGAVGIVCGELEFRKGKKGLVCSIRIQVSTTTCSLCSRPRSSPPLFGPHGGSRSCLDFSLCVAPWSNQPSEGRGLGVLLLLQNFKTSLEAAADTRLHRTA